MSKQQCPPACREAKTSSTYHAGPQHAEGHMGTLTIRARVFCPAKVSSPPMIRCPADYISAQRSSIYLRLPICMSLVQYQESMSHFVRDISPFRHFEVKSTQYFCQNRKTLKANDVCSKSCIRFDSFLFLHRTTSHGNPSSRQTRRIC